MKQQTRVTRKKTGRYYSFKNYGAEIYVEDIHGIIAEWDGEATTEELKKRLALIQKAMPAGRWTIDAVDTYKVITSLTTRLDYQTEYKVVASVR